MTKTSQKDTALKITEIADYYGLHVGTTIGGGYTLERKLPPGKDGRTIREELSGPYDSRKEVLAWLNGYGARAGLETKKMEPQTKT